MDFNFKVHACSPIELKQLLIILGQDLATEYKTALMFPFLNIVFDFSDIIWHVTTGVLSTSVLYYRLKAIRCVSVGTVPDTDVLTYDHSMPLKIFYSNANKRWWLYISN